MLSGILNILLFVLMTGVALGEKDEKAATYMAIWLCFGLALFVADLSILLAAMNKKEGQDPKKEVASG